MTAGTSLEVVVLSDADEVSVQAAERFVAAASGAVERAGTFSVSLAGGSTPIKTYDLLASEPYVSQVEWGRVNFFWGDERCVPLDHPDSNCGSAIEALLSRLRIPDENIHRMRGEIDPRRAALEYEEEVRRWVAGEPPHFDLIMLGMGDDGHTASLFPHSPALDETDRLITENYVEELGAWRLTFTPTLINAAREVHFLVTGEKKAQAVKAVLEGPRDPDTYPSQLVTPRNGRLLWLLDEAAASQLTRDHP